MADPPVTRLPHSYLFVSGAERSELESAMAAGADIVVADWEDLVPAHRKAEARSVTGEVFGATATRDTPLRLVRVNHPVTEQFHAADLAALGGMRIDGVVIPKADLAAMAVFAPLGLSLYPVIEDAQGVRGAYELAALDATAAVLIGLADLAWSLGVASHPDALTHARSRILIDVKAAGKPVIDVPFVNTAEFTLQAHESRALGFDGKICRRAEHVLACAIFAERRAAAVEG